MIEFQNVTKKYGESESLSNVSFEIEKGSFVFLVGSTGSGKTTIFRLLIHDLLATEGMIRIGEWDVTKLPHSKIPQLRRKVGVIFQDLKLLMDRTVLENVVLPLEFIGVKKEEAKQKGIEALNSVGLSDKVDKFPLQLSGGERQRVAIARTLVFDPEVILADEPTGNLDLQTSLQILDLLESINKRGTTIFMATHNEEIIRSTHQRVLFLEKGKLIQDKSAKQSAHSKDPKKEDIREVSDDKSTPKSEEKNIEHKSDTVKEEVKKPVHEKKEKAKLTLEDIKAMAKEITAEEEK